MLAEVRVVFVTAPVEQAEALARSLVDRRLVACVNIVPSVRSVYRWQGEVETADEALLVMKTSASTLEALVEAVEVLHPYDVPEVLAVPVSGGLPAYAAWVLAEVEPA